MKISIIGAGIAGIAASIRLAHKGHQVTVFEANSSAGGKLSEVVLDDFRFDAGPSLFTMPQYIEELIELTGRKVSDYFEYERLDTVCHYFWEDETRLNAYANPQKFAQEVEDKLAVSRDVILKKLADSERKYDLTVDIFLNSSLHKLKTYFSTKVLKMLVNLPRLSLLSSMNSANERDLPHPKLVQLFNRFATYNGSDPYQASGVLNMIPHLEHGIGAFFPKGGMYAITKALYRLACDVGVDFQFNQKVDEIIVENGQAKAVLIQGQRRDFDAVVSNMDVFFTYKKLLPNQVHPKRTLAQEKSSSALIFYWGIERQFKELDLHNIFFSDDYKAEFQAIFKDKKLYTDPTVYVNISQKQAPHHAPEGCENWFTMINVPHMDGQDWEQFITESREHILDKLSRILKVDIRQYIRCEHILDPRTIESITSSHLGSLYGTSSNHPMAAFLRHPNFSKSIKQLYFCGGSVHPGGGIPLCLLSAKIVSELIEPV